MERLAHASGRALADVPRNEMESLWDQAKISENNRSRPRAKKAATRP